MDASLNGRGPRDCPGGGPADDYALTGTLDQAAERIGNMVALFDTKAIAESVYEEVLEPYRRQRQSLAA